MRALVTGSAGFVGRHMCAALTAAGYATYGVDIANGDDARDFFRRSGSWYDLVVHAAAVIGGREQIDGAPLGLAVNLELDAAMFAWAARTRPGRVVCLSSSAVYPVMLQGRDGRPLHEDAVTTSSGLVGMPDQLYGWSKLTGELLAARARAEGVPVTVVRPFSGYGEDQDDCYPFPKFADRAAQRLDPFEIWGSGQQVRDFVHVDDVIAAILRLAELGVDGPVNIGTGTGTSMLQLAQMFCRAAGYAPEIRVRPDAPMGVAYRVADAAALGRYYIPRITLAEGIDRALAARVPRPDAAPR